MLAAAKSSERIVDAFAGTGLDTHFLRANGVNQPVILNEYDPFRYITHHQLRDNPVGVVLAVEHFVGRLCKMVERFNDGDTFESRAKAAQGYVANFFQQQAERLIEPGQNLPDLSLKKMPVKMKATPELAALYLVMQNQTYANRSIQADATSKGLMKIMSRAEVMTIVNDRNKVKKFRLGRKYLFDSRGRFFAVHRRLRNVNIINRDAWTLIRDTADKGDFVWSIAHTLGKRPVTITRQRTKTEK